MTVAVAMVGLAIVCALALAVVGGLLAGRATATTAADAAALAAAAATFPPLELGSPLSAAADVSAANGAELVTCACARDSSWNTRVVAVRVAVIVDLPILGAATIEAVSRAEFRPASLIGTSLSDQGSAQETDGARLAERFVEVAALW